MKVSRKKLTKLLETFNVDTTKMLTESRVVLGDKLALYANHKLIENRKVQEFKYNTDGTEYTLEILGGNYYLTREIDGRERRIILTKDEIDIVRNKDITDEVMEELTNYTDYIKARFGL